MSRILDSLLELQSVLTELRALRDRYENLPDSTRSLGQERDQIQGQLEALDDAIAEAEQERRAAEGEAALCQEKLHHFQQQIERVQTQREYGALLSEIDTMTAKQREQEELALGAIERIEQSTAEKTTLAERFSEIDATFSEQREVWEAERPAVQKQIDDLDANAATLKEKLPAPVLAQYERLYELHQGDPLARVERLDRGVGPMMFRCAVCNYSVRPQVVVELQNTGGLVSCDCGRQRIFYFEE